MTVVFLTVEQLLCSPWAEKQRAALITTQKYVRACSLPSTQAGWVHLPFCVDGTSPAFSSPRPRTASPTKFTLGQGTGGQGLVFQAVGHKEDIQQPAMRNTPDLSTLPTARLSLPQNHEPDSDHGCSTSCLVTGYFILCPGTGQPELWIDMSESSQRVSWHQLLQPLMSLFTKELSSENMNGKIKLHVPELPGDHGGTWV